MSTAATKSPSAAPTSAIPASVTEELSFSSVTAAAIDGPSTHNRVARAFAVRQLAAGQDAFQPAPPQVDNGDEALYADKSGTYTKGVLQTGVGLVNLTAYDKFKKALNSGNPSDFDAIPLGGLGRKLNGPQGGMAFDLECLDASQFSVPPAPAVASEEYATELVELYWASLLRDVAFTDYPTNQTAKDAAMELTSMVQHYAGPRDAMGNVTPDLLFRGGTPGGLFAGENFGPYVSQFLLQDADFGALPLVQKYRTATAGLDYVKTAADFLQVQNGLPGTLPLTPIGFYLHDGRGLGAYTHEDVLYEAYFNAYLVMNKLGIQPNAGNPYNTDPTQNGFNTFGQPDIAATIAAVAREALQAVWYQKWFVHLRHRPESGGALVALAKAGTPAQAQPSATVLNSTAVARSAAAHAGSYFLTQAFPEGSPMHPAYPTGHGTVGGACITALKFFYNCDVAFPLPAKVALNNGSALQNYTGGDAAQMTVNGELHKLAHNISFGHGIHAGIHWRSDTDTSIQLGEAVAISVLKDRAHTYNEKFSVQLTKVDGTKVTISNQ